MNTWGHHWPRKKLLVHCDNQAVADIWKKGSTDHPQIIRMLYFCAARHNIHVIITHVDGTTNCIGDALTRFQVQRSQTGSGGCQDPRYHSCMADSALEGLLSHYQRLGVAISTRWTYQAEIKALHQFCAQYTILPFPASSLTLRYFCCYMARQVSYKIIKVYLAGIHFEHLERGFEDPTKDELLQLLCTGIKRSQGAQTRTRLPVTITVLQTLKSQLRLDSAFSPLEKHLLWAAFIMAFYGFLRASEFATPSLKWQHV